MFQDVIQRLFIVQQTKTRLVLRELPLLDWIIAFGLTMIGLVMSFWGFWLSTGIAGAIACYFIIQGQVRMIYFDVAEEGMAVSIQTPFSKETVNAVKLDEIRRSYLFRGDDDGSQIVLVHQSGEESGISVYSEDLSNWKEPIVIAINGILHEYRKQQEESEEA